MSSKVETLLRRRTFLKGAGGASIALPLLMGSAGSARAAGPVPERFTSIYFGNGFPANLSTNGLTGAIAPLAPFAGQLTMLRGINAVSSAPGTGHIPGSASFCCAQDSGGNDKGGPSLDWVAYQSLNPGTQVPVLAAGAYGRTKPERLRWIHSWRAAGQPNDPYDDTMNIFNLLFGGSAMPNPSAGAEEARYRHRLSVLDAVTDEYTNIRDGGAYPASVRSVISNHLDLVRELEKRVLDLHTMSGQASPTCARPAAVALSSRTNLGMANYTKVWGAMTDLYVLGLRCDLFRFGNLVITNGGDEFPLTVMGQTASDIHGDWYHNYANRKGQVDYVINWEFQMIAQFLQKLNDPAFKDVDGNTLLNGTTVLIGTELSDPVSHSRNGMTFWLAGAQKRFKTGTVELSNRPDTDMYNTVLQSMGVRLAASFGKKDTYTAPLPILV
jgi:hypothetical protein